LGLCSTSAALHLVLSFQAVFSTSATAILSDSLLHSLRVPEEGNVVRAADHSRPEMKVEVKVIGMEAILCCLELCRIQLVVGGFLAVGLRTVNLFLIFRFTRRKMASASLGL
jgi:hypothetical protein